MNYANTIRFISAHPLNRHQKLRGLWRYVMWQLGSRIVPGPVVCDFVGGSFLLARPGPSMPGYVAFSRQQAYIFPHPPTPIGNARHSEFRAREATVL